MRLLAVRGENLASLADPFELRFDAAPVATAGLFAITGPTGAGKSSLFDAVCLALFDGLPRLTDLETTAEIGAAGAPAEQRLRQSDPRGVLRHGAGAGYAEVDFVGRDGRAYRSRWDVWRSRRRAAGALQAQTITLTDLETGARIGDKKTDTLAEIRRRVGLTFDQFRRSALLAQGEFDAFLSARASERAELLERITGAEIYARISRAAHARDRAERAEIARIETQIGEHAPLSAEDRAAAETALSAAQSALEVAERRAANLEAARAWRRTDAELARRDEALRRQIDAATTAKRDAAATARALARIAQREAEGALEEHARWLAGQTALAPLLTELDRVIAAVRARAGAAAEIETRRRAIADAQADTTALAEKLERLLAAEAEAAQTLDAARAAATAAERDADAQDIAALQSEETRLRDGLRACEAGREAQARAAAAAREVETRRADAAEARTAMRTAADLMTRLDAEIAPAQARLSASRDALRRWETASGDAAQALRAALEPSEPCPVCGARDHAVEAFEAELRTAREAQQARVAEAQTALDDLSRRRLEAESAEAASTRRAEQAEADAAAREAAREAEMRAVAAARAKLDGLAQPDASFALVEEQLVAAEKSLAARLVEADRLLKARETTRRALDVATQAHRDAAEATRGAEAAVATSKEAAARAAAALSDARSGLESAEAVLAPRLDPLDAAWREDDPAALEARCRKAADRYRARLAARDAAEAALRAATVQADEAATLLGDAAAEVPATDREGDAAAALEAARRAAGELLDLGGRRAQNAETLSAHRAARPGDLAEDADIETLEADLAQARAATEARRGSLESAKRVLANDDETRARRGTLAEELTERRAQAAVWARLNDMIGSHDGSKFRRYAQSITLRRLVALANLRLADIHPRYRLECALDANPEKPSLALQIVDRDMGDEVRGAHNLSGGERFLVSLALSLGLASLSSDQGVRVETLFIDEGFGALDGESLAMAVSALEALQATGRLVGVISHVAELKERIPVQVVVRPEGGGKSRIEVVSG